MYIDAAFYPSIKTEINGVKDIVSNTRFSTGLGLIIPLGVTSILIYYNTLNLNT